MRAQRCWRAHKTKLADRLQQIGTSYTVAPVSHPSYSVWASENVRLGHVVVMRKEEPSKSTCTCGYDFTLGIPCKCKLAVPIHLGIQPQLVYKDERTTARWRAMFEAVGDFNFVIERDVLMRDAGDEVVPLAGKPPKGRPADGGRIPSAAERSRRKLARLHETNMAARYRDAIATAAGAEES